MHKFIDRLSAKHIKITSEGQIYKSSMNYTDIKYSPVKPSKEEEKWRKFKRIILFQSI